MNNATAIAMLVSLITGWALGWRVVSSWLARRHGVSRGLAHFCGLTAGVLSALGLFCVVGAFFDSKEALSTRVLMACLGLVLLAPFAYVRAKTGLALVSASAPEPEPLTRTAASAPTGPSATPGDRAAVAPIAPGKPRPSTPAPDPGGVSLPCTFIFSYRDQEGDYTLRTVNVSSVSSNGAHTYLEGFCQTRTDFRTFRTDRIRGDLTDADTGELISVKRLLSSVRTRSSMDYRPAAPAPQTRKAPAKAWTTAVVFTGFSAKRRAELEDLAALAGWDVRVTVGSTLDYLVAGPRAGPSKVAKAEDLGVSVVDEDMFLTLADA